MALYEATFTTTWEPESLANKCHRDGCCPIDYMKCPFDSRCHDVTADDWKRVLKRVQTPFKEGELVLVKDNPSCYWMIRIFKEYVPSMEQPYCVYRTIEDYNSNREYVCYRYCEKLRSIAEKDIFIGSE